VRTQQLRPARWTRSFAIGLCRFAPVAKKIIASHISGRFGVMKPCYSVLDGWGLINAEAAMSAPAP